MKQLTMGGHEARPKLAMVCKATKAGSDFFSNKSPGYELRGADPSPNPNPKKAVDVHSNAKDPMGEIMGTRLKPKREKALAANEKSKSF
jgi:hypothetical protein